jgi:hypothetical protein
MQRAVKRLRKLRKRRYAMKKILSILALLMAASMLFWVVGCGGDDDDDDCGENVAPQVSSVVPASGSISLNATITVSLNKAVDSIAITLGGDAITPATTDNKVYTLTPTKEGAGQALTITAEDACGDSLDPAFAGASFDVAAADSTAPELVGGDCEPADGADGLDPADITEIVLVFSEDLADVTVDMIEPSENISATIDGDTVTVEFLGGWSLGNEQEVQVEIAATDLAGNAANLEYGFTTMAKE